MLPHDFDLQASHLQALSSRDAVVALFAQLGYNTEARLPMTPAALGFSDTLAHEITHIERIADHDSGELQVYLLEMKRVTVVLTQALARALRNRAGNFLLVLTADYERVDFVLMDLVRPESAQIGIGMRQAYLRPRALTIDRRNPTPVDLRVLRRFSYTEIDPYYQLDKLRSAYGIAEWSEPFFNNRALFSDYYLNERLRSLSEWQDDPAPAFRALTKLMADARQKFTRVPEAALRSELYEPLFRALGWTFEAQKGGSDDDEARPGYMLIGPNGARVPCLVYVWDRYLDGPDETRDADTPSENPVQIVVGLLDRDDHSGWAIVTNGKVWRLYSARAHSRATNYYEIDLEETLASPDVNEAFRYFWLFFRSPHPIPPPSATGEGAREGVAFLNFLLDESASYANALGERLKDRVFEDAFPYFAEGFIRHNRTHEWNDEELSQAFQATLTFLYRLLFLLYAEARDLLPVRETRGYYEISLQRLKEEIAHSARNVADEADDWLEKAYSATETGLYDRLMELFRAIDVGDTSLNVPIYNGGLFITFEGRAPRPADADPPEVRNARFLHEHKIPDRYLALGLDRLARDIDDKTHALAFIDYKSLGVRQLGSIYEGLLEFKLRVAPAKMAVAQGKKADEIVPYAEAKKKGLKIRTEGRGANKTEVTLPKGAVYLENDQHERKATGSYYTPDYIVKYIVQHTVGPALDEKFEALRPRLRQAAKRFHDAVQRKQTIEKVTPDKPVLLNDIATDVLRDLFEVKVLDPAMGSGHFLVEAVDFITDRMLRFLNAFPFVSHFFEGQRRTILEEMERQQVTVDPGRLTDVNLLKRHVLKRCICGVDLNPMAVELAKVSLWLDCFTLGAPLSFLDHHLRCGNSLLGTMAREADRELQGGKSPQMTFLTGPFVGLLRSAEIMRGISAIGDATIEQVHQSASLFTQFEQAAKPYKQLLDVFVIRHFGVVRADEFLRLYGAEVMQANPKNLAKDYQRVLAERERLYRQHRFFHWDLEFPEVFIDLEHANWKENSGFDAVIGNPPYVSAWSMTDVDASIRSAIVGLVQVEGKELSRHWDLYIPFLLRSNNLCRLGGRFSFIIPNAFSREKYAMGTRKFLLENAHIERLVSFGEENVFEEVSRQTLVPVFNKTPPDPESTKTRIDDPFRLLGMKLSHDEAHHELPQKLFYDTPEHQIRHKAGDERLSILNRVNKSSIRLGNICYVNYGAQVSSKKQGEFGKSDVVSRTSVKGAKKFIDGKNLSRYEIEWDGRYLDYRYQAMYGPRAPELFESPKVMVRDVTGANEQLVVSFDDSGLYCDHLIICATYYENVENTELQVNFEGYEKLPSPNPDLLYLTGILGSTLLTWYFREIFATGTLQSSYSHTYPQQIRAFPIRRIAFTTPERRRSGLVEKGRKLYARCLKEKSYLCVLEFVDHHLSQQPEESDVVHDLLAFLAGQMIDLNKQKQAKQKRFLGWLEGVLKIKPDNKGSTGLDALTGKTTLRNYLGDYQKGEEHAPLEAIVDVLQKNRTRIGVSLSDAKFMARLKSEYEKSLAALLPIKDHLARTDGLIDQVVYRLYGLTEEEIAVVESRAGT